jgi:peptide deformylase
MWTTTMRVATTRMTMRAAMRAAMREATTTTTRARAKKGFLFGEVQEAREGGEASGETANGTSVRRSGGGSVRWSAPLSIQKYPAACLRANNAPVETFDANLEALSRAMFTIMYETVGCGLAAPQVGVNYRMMVYNEAGEPGRGKEVVLCNPKIVKYSKETDMFEEGCLSFPKMYADVEVRRETRERATVRNDCDERTKSR